MSRGSKKDRDGEASGATEDAMPRDPGRGAKDGDRRASARVTSTRSPTAISTAPPVLEALDETRNWDGQDALDGMEGREAQALRESTTAEEVLADAVADRRQVLLDRLDEARELGLGEIVEVALAATEPDAGGTPVVRDDDFSATSSR